MTQDRITEYGMDRPGDTDFNGWFKATRRLDLNRMANEAFHLAVMKVTFPFFFFLVSQTSHGPHA
jgi:hypothetical protein